jgi:hypothetical protein
LKIISTTLSVFLILGMLTSKDVDAQHSVGSTVQGQVTIQTSSEGTKVIPIPPGNWQVAYRNRFRAANNSNGNANHFVETVLLEINNLTLKKVLYIRVNDDSLLKKYSDEPCKRDNTIHRNDYGTRLWTQRCLLVAHVTSYFNTDSKSVSATRALLLNNKVSFSNTVFGMAYTQFDTYGNFLTVSLRFNPEAYGFSDTSSEYNFSAWHRDLIQKDPARAQFASRVINYSEAYATALQSAFNKRPVPFLIPFDSANAPMSETNNRDVGKQCADIGFKQGTSAYSNCIKELDSRKGR